jgi:succinate dehydrogenase/fumarate reductase flavoprotein subunit
MASADKENFKKLVESLMKACKDLVFVFTNRNSIGRQLDFCSEVQYELGRLTIAQSKTLFFNKISRNITKKEMDEFFNLDRNLKEMSEHSFFDFLNGHP